MAEGSGSPHYQVHETFASLQGEGFHAGETAWFLRLQGCPVGCVWCDAKLTWYAGGEKLTLEQIILRCQGECGKTPAWLIITGGEPLLYDLDPLIKHWRAWTEPFGRRTIALETSGAFAFKGVERPDWITLSPKAANNWRVDENVLIAADEIKYVVDDDFDIHWHDDLMRERSRLIRDASGGLFDDEGRPTNYWHHRIPYIYLMPEGSPPRHEMVEKTLHLLRQRPFMRFSPRLQYAYPAITALEGDTNDGSITKEEARERSYRLRHTRKATRGPPPRRPDREV